MVYLCPNHCRLVCLKKTETRDMNSRSIPNPPIPRRSRRLCGAFAALALASLASTPSALATEFLNESLRDSTLPVGWAQSDVTFQSAAGGYALFEALTASLTSAVFDASAADSLTLSYSVAKFGSGDDGPLTLEYSLNGGVDWLSLGASSVPTSSTYIDDSVTIPATSETMAIRFTRPDSPSQKRLRDVVVADADAPLPPLEIISFTPAPGASEVALEPTLSLTFNQSIQAGTGQIRIFDFVTDALVEAVDVTSLLITNDTLSTGLAAPLEMDTIYYVLLDGGAVEDLAGVPFAGIADNTAWSFTTLAPDTTGPVPVSFIPSSGFNNVSLDTLELSLFFDEEIFIVGTADIEIRRVADDSLFEAIDPMDFFSVLTGDPEEMILLLFDEFEIGTAYYVFFPAGTVEDEFGNPNLAFGTPTSDIPWTFTTFAPLVLEDGVPYEEDFLSFTGVIDAPANLPSGWFANGPALNYGGDWGSGTSAGFRGNNNVLGYQHTGTTGTLVKGVTFVNNTGTEITELSVSYLGRVERPGAERSPAYVVEVDGMEVPGLSYSTASGVDELVEFTVTGLNIPAGETFSITWTSNRGFNTTGFSKQIGIANVTVEAVFNDVDAPVFSLAAGTYFEDQTVFITNFGSYDPSVEVRYTLDGSDPAAGVGLVYDDTTGITVADGNGPVELRAIAVDTDTSLISLIAARSFTFPLNVNDLATLRVQPTGSTIYRVTNDLVLTAQTGFRNTKFFQDDSGAGIQIDDPSGVITSFYATGDAIGEMIGTLSLFQGQLQMVPLIDGGTPVSTDNVVMPVVRAISDLGFDDQSILVSIPNVAFNNADGIATFGGGGFETPINDFTASGIFRNVFGESDVSGALLPAGRGSVIGIIQERNTGLTISARSLADLSFDDAPVGDDFAAWIDQFDVGALTGPFDEPAGDGVPNILKHVLGLAPNVAVTGSVVTASDAGPGTITFGHTRIKPDALASDAVFGYEWSMNLADWSADGAPMGGVTVDFGQQTVLDSSNPAFDLVEVTATVTDGAADRLFIRILADVDAPQE